MESKLIIHMVSSVDGYVAKKDNSIHWFETTDRYEPGVEESMPSDVSEMADCYVMGSHTYELAIQLSAEYGWPYGEVPTVVLTTRPLVVNRTNIEIYSGDLEKLVTDLKGKFRNIWVVGGPAVAGDFIQSNLADEIRQTILPIILGDGLPFFDQVKGERPLHLKQVRAYKTGMVELCYEILK